MTLVALLLLACGAAEEPAASPSAAASPAATSPAGAEKAPLQVGTVHAADPAGTESEEGAALAAADCDTVESEALEPGTCITGKLSCGDTVVGHTVGGSNQFDSRFYEKFFCTPATTDHDDGNERVYELELPDGAQHADVWLDTPCADLDLAAMRWDEPGCPTGASPVSTCEMNRADGKRGEHIRIASRTASRWLIVVEGEGMDEGAFGLRVTCGAGL